MIVCEICGKEFDKPHYYEPYNKVCSSECFSEKLWRIRGKEYLDGEPFIIIDGCMYTDGEYRETNDTFLLGHAGRKFTIKMNDGTEIFTNNLWCGGNIPENHRKVLADNAVFVH